MSIAATARTSLRLSPHRVVTSEPRNANTVIENDDTEGRTQQSLPWPVRDETIVFHDFALESGARIGTVHVHYRLEGALAPSRDNLVLVIHALTGTAHASEWWRGVIGLGAAIDPTRHAILCANLLGGCNGTTGATNDDVDALPPFTTRDQAALLARVLDALGVEQPLLVCGGSLGGMVALEFAASFPERVRGAVVLAAPAAQTAQGIVWGTIMQRAVAVGGVEDGLALARMVGMLSYRTPEGLERRFGRARNADGEFLVSEWLSSHGERLVQRFDATSYVSLLAAMNTHDVGRGRGGIAAALAPLAGRLTGVGIPGELLYPAESVREWTSAASAHYVDLPSIHGHDAFLLEITRVGAIISDALVRAESVSSSLSSAVLPPVSPAVSASSASSAPTAASPSAYVFVGIGATPRFFPPTPTHPLSRPTHRDSSRRVAPGSNRRDDSTGTAPTGTLRVALAGCGHVGGSLLDLLGERTITDTPAVRVDRVLVRDALRLRPSLAQAIARGIAPDHARITDPTELIDDDIDILVEAIGGTTTARTLVETALRRGIRVVTVNKALLAERGTQLAALARSNGTRIDFEGAVAGAIPVVRCLRSGAAGVGITRVTGILNGTSNFVLERVAEGASLAGAVATAQQLGYAEADPTRDLSGEDAEDKLRVLAWLAFGIDPASLKVVRRGIDAETAAWAARVATAGDRVKLIASCALENSELVARIIPTRVTADDPWARVTGAFNRIAIESSSAGTLVFHGLGAGGRATAGAVLGDVLTPR